MLVVSEENFLNSFGKKELMRAKKYLLAKELFEKISNKSKISRLVEIPNRTVQEWLNNKKAPNSIRQLNKLKKMNLIPLKISKDTEFILFLDIFSFLFGDGHLRRNLCCCLLYGGKEDLVYIHKKLFETFGIKSKVTTNEKRGSMLKCCKSETVREKIVGICSQLSINSSALSRLFYLARVPKGDKVAQSFILPNWLINSDKFVRKRFLGVLFGNELSIPKLRNKKSFGAVIFGLHKIEKYRNNLNMFLSQIKTMLEGFSIEVSYPRFEKLTCLRKDGNYSGKSYLYIKSNVKNILELHKQIPILYAYKKAKKFDLMVEKIIKNISKYQFDWEIYNKAIELHSKGFGHVKIFKKLNLQQNYLYKLNSWIYSGVKPKFYSARFLMKKGAKGML